MDIMKKLVEARRRGELKGFLCGEEKYQIEPSQYAPGVQPTDVGKVLSKAIYKLYQDEPEIKEEYEKVLLSMAAGNSFEVYVVVLYIMSQMFKEKNKLSPFYINLSDIFSKLQTVLATKKEELESGVTYPNGLVNKYAWNDIERFDRVCRKEYDLQLLV